MIIEYMVYEGKVEHRSPYNVGTQARRGEILQSRMEYNRVQRYNIHKLYTDSNTPLSRNSIGKDVQAGSKLGEDWQGQSLGEDVGILRAGWHMQDSNFAKGHTIPNKMQVNLNMLGSLMLDRIACKVGGTDVVAIHHGARLGGPLSS